MEEFVAIKFDKNNFPLCSYCYKSISGELVNYKLDHLKYSYTIDNLNYVFCDAYCSCKWENDHA